MGSSFSPTNWAVGQLAGGEAKNKYAGLQDPLNLVGGQDQANGSGGGYVGASAGPKPNDIRFQSALVGGQSGYSNLGEANTMGTPVSGTMNADGSPVSQNAPLGMMANAYTLSQPTSVKANTSSLDQMRGLAGSGPDSFLNQQMKLNDMNTSSLMDKNAQGSQNSYYNTLSNMAQTGGVSGAARERALANANKTAFGQGMDIQRQGMMNGLNTQATGMQKQFDMNNTIQNQDNQLFNANTQQQQMQQDAQKFNIGNTLNEIQAQRAFDQQKYTTDMAAWGANKSSDAQIAAAQNTGKKSSFLGL